MSLIRRPLAVALLGAGLATSLIACKKEEPAANKPAATSVAATTPTAAVDAVIAGLKSGDVKALAETMIPPTELERVRKEWKERQQRPIKPEEAREFAENMAKLTAPGAEDQMFAELKPKLAEFDSTYGAQMPMWVGIGQNFVNEAIKNNKDLTPEQRDQATQTINGLAKWAMETKFTDEAKAKQAIALLCAGAREMNLKSLDEARKLDFDQALVKMSIALRQTKKLFDVYGLSMDQVLGTVKTEVVSQDATSAKVKVSYTVFGVAVSGENEMVSENGRWYGKKFLEDLRKPKSIFDDSKDDSTAQGSDDAESEGDGDKSDNSADMPETPVPPAKHGGSPLPPAKKS